MVPNGTPEAALNAVVSAIDWHRRLKASTVCARAADPESRRYPPNLPCWRNFPLAEKIRANKVPVNVDNRRKCSGAALRETFGERLGFRTSSMRQGTGIGTGIVFDEHHLPPNRIGGRMGASASIYRAGTRNSKRRCIEILAAGPAIGAKRAKNGGLSLCVERQLSLTKGNVSAIHSQHVGEAFESGDPLGARSLKKTGPSPNELVGNCDGVAE